MEKALIIERIKLLAEEKDDMTIETYLDITKEHILSKAFPFKDHSEMEVPSKYHSIWIEATVFLLNKRGAEGEVKHDENGISRTYGTDDLPKSLLNRITPFCDVV